MLTYTDIDNIISFVNSSTPLSLASGKTVQIKVDPNTMTITTNIIIDNQVPPLFGYQGYNNGSYKTFKGDCNPSTPEFMHNQVFPSDKFIALLNGFWAASIDGHTGPVNFPQTMPVLQNNWFGVLKRDTITVLWVYTNPADNWSKQLSEDVKELIPDNFPNYKTIDTELSPTDVNLLSSFTAWCAAGEGNSGPFLDLYKDRE